jgi:hypothetical protein
MRLLSRRRDRPRDTPAIIADPTDVTVMERSGAVRSIQGADIWLPEDVLADLWSPMYLERLARTYWRFLSRVTLGLIRVHYGESERAVVFLRRPFVLLRFQPPEYELASDRGIVRWRIRDGLLVSKRDEGYLEIDVRRERCDEPGEAKLHLEIEVANFYPAIATWLTRFVYTQTQSRIHVLVTYGFLRSLARLELEESAVGRFAVPAGATNGNGSRPPLPPEDQTVGDTPWLVVAALAAGVLAGTLAAEHALRGNRDLRAARQLVRRS